MWRLAPCLDTLCAGLAQDEALRLVAGAGLETFEFWDWRGRDVEALAREAAQVGLRAVIFSGNTFDEPLVDAEAHPRALAHLGRSIEMAQRLDTRLLVAHVGYARADRSPSAQWEAAVQGLRGAGDLAGAAGITLAVEPLNSVLDHPGYFLDSLPGALRLLEEVNHPSVALLLDVYHMRLMHGDLLTRLPAALSRAAHVHVADVPGRREPGTGAVRWDAVLQAFRDGAYRGAIGLECWPSQSPQEALRRSGEVLQ